MVLFCSGHAVLGALGALGARQQHTQALLRVRELQRHASSELSANDSRGQSDPIVSSLLQHANHRLANLMSAAGSKVDTYNAGYYYSMGSAVTESDADRNGV